MADIIQFRRDTAAQWTSINPVLADHEFGYETDTGLCKKGDGATAWNSLSYYINESSNTYCFSAGRDSSSVTNSFLRANNGLYTNVTPFIIPFNSTLFAISASTRRSGSNYTWSAEVWKITGVVAALSITTATKGQRSDLSVSFTTGEELGIYCNGTGIDSPRITCWLRRG